MRDLLGCPLLHNRSDDPQKHLICPGRPRCCSGVELSSTCRRGLRVGSTRADDGCVFRLRVLPILVLVALSAPFAGEVPAYAASHRAVLAFGAAASRARAAGSNDPSTLIGSAPPPASLPGWHRVFADDFSENVPMGQFPSAVSSRWWAYPNGWLDTTRAGEYDPQSTVSVHDGMMDIDLHALGTASLVAAPVPRIPGASAQYGQLYGMYAVRFRADRIRGYKTAWLLWPDDNRWPQDGEIDFPEGNLTDNFCGYVHYEHGTAANDQAQVCGSSTYQEWHTAVLEWTAGRVVFALDGRVLGSVTQRIPDTPMHFVLQTENATWGPAAGPSDSGHVYIDWVAIYRAAELPHGPFSARSLGTRHL